MSVADNTIFPLSSENSMHPQIGIPFVMTTLDKDCNLFENLVEFTVNRII